MNTDKFMEYEQAIVDYEEDNNIVYCCFPLDIGKVEIFMTESSCERGITYDIFINKEEFDGGIYKDDLFQDEIGDFEYHMCVNDALRHVKQRFQESDLIINT